MNCHTHTPPCRRAENHPVWRMIVAGLLACAVLNACTTTRSLASVASSDLTQVVRPGDTVSCTLRDGSVVSITAKTVTPDKLADATREVQAKDIARLEVKQVSAGKTAGMVVLVVLLGLAGYGFSHMAFFPPPP